mgnify:CR=1 FL=1
MNLGEIMEKKGIKVSDFKDVEVPVRTKEDEEIEFLEEYLKLLERKASKKEICRFANEHGFLSEQHLAFYVKVCADYDDLKENYDDIKDYISEKQKSEMEEQLKFLAQTKYMAKLDVGYRNILRQTKMKDINAYGIDILKDYSRQARNKYEIVDVGTF